MEYFFQAAMQPRNKPPKYTRTVPSPPQSPSPSRNRAMPERRPTCVTQSPPPVPAVAPAGDRPTAGDWLPPGLTLPAHPPAIYAHVRSALRSAGRAGAAPWQYLQSAGGLPPIPDPLAQSSGCASFRSNSSFGSGGFFPLWSCHSGCGGGTLTLTFEGVGGLT